MFDTMEKPQQALEEFQRALAIDLEQFPADSTRIAIDYTSIGIIHGELDHRAEQVDYAEKSVAIFRKHPTDSKSELSVALLDLGNAYRDSGRSTDAIATYEQARASAIEVNGERSLQLADVLTSYGLVLVSTDHVRARAMWLNVLAIREAKLGPEHPDLAQTLSYLGQEAYMRDAHREVVPYLSRAIAILEKAAPGLPRTTEMIDLRGRSELALGQRDSAISDLTRARDDYHAQHLDEQSASTRLALADALWQQGGSARREAAVEVHAAIEQLQALPKADPAQLASARAWLASHR
jgi:tetratricopeptide (TPR) repeat protein